MLGYILTILIACGSNESSNSTQTNTTKTETAKTETAKTEETKTEETKTEETKTEETKTEETKTEETKTEKTKTEETKTEETKTARTGEQVYTSVCLSCHQATGQGLTGVYPPLAGSEWPVKEPSIPIRIVLHGLMGEIEVAGNKYNNVMSPQGMLLNDQEIANVLNYVRSSWGNKADVEITADMVQEQREKYPNHGIWNASELK